MLAETALVPVFESQETVPCPLCGGADAKLVFHACDRLFALPGQYSLVRCESCSLSYVNPRPTFEALGRHYPDDYFAVRPPELAPAWLRPIARLALRLQTTNRIRMAERVLGRLTPGTKVLDVGCGLNEYVGQVGRLRGCDGIGVEFKPEVVTYVREKQGTPIVQGTLQTAGFEEGQFDLVSMNEYLEHEANPVEVLTEARRVTRRGGHVAIEIPHIAGLPARIFGSRWGMLDIPRHLVFYTPETLARMLERCGYRLIHTRTFGIPFSIGASLILSLGYKRLGRMNTFDSLFVGLSSLPFLPFAPFLREFIFAVARAE
jgi:SAM-dependent methyltransferase